MARLTTKTILPGASGGIPGNPPTMTAVNKTATTIDETIIIRRSVRGFRNVRGLICATPFCPFLPFFPVT